MLAPAVDLTRDHLTLLMCVSTLSCTRSTLTLLSLYSKHCLDTFKGRSVAAKAFSKRPMNACNALISATVSACCFSNSVFQYVMSLMRYSSFLFTSVCVLWVKRAVSVRRREHSSRSLSAVARSFSPDETFKTLEVLHCWGVYLCMALCVTAVYGKCSSPEDEPFKILDGNSKDLESGLNVWGDVYGLPVWNEAVYVVS